MSDQPTRLEQAIQLAARAHEGQKTLDGQPYILHPLRMMLRFPDEETRIVAVLHDVLEDSMITSWDLQQMGFSEVVVSAVETLTRAEEEDYPEYIERVAQNPLATRVKITDLMDNLDPQRASTRQLPAAQVHRYLDALRRLTELADAADQAGQQKAGAQ